MSACRVMALGAAGERLRVDILGPRVQTAEIQPAVEERWRAMCAANPRLFDGRMLSYLGFDEAAASITACVASYKHLAVQPQVPTGVTQLGVTGVLTQGKEKDRRVLLARRGRGTLLYPGRWEVAPSGGVDAPPSQIRQLTIANLREQLRREVHEELGLIVAPADATPIALCHDPVAPSVDIVFGLHISGGVEPAELNWEYDDLRWLPLCDLPHALASIDIIPPSRALLGWL